MVMEGIQRSMRVLLSLTFLLWAGSTLAQAVPPTEHGLRSELTKLVQPRSLSAAKIGLAVLDVPSGRVLFEYNATQLLPIASNVKLVTSAAALTALSPSFRFKTAIYGNRKGGETIEGDLYLKGFGDPTLREEHLWRLANNLYQLGIREVKGQLVIDENYFDKERLAPLFASKDTDAYYRAPNGALSLEENAISVRVLGASKAGQPPRVVVSPATPYVRLQQSVVTVAGRRRSRIAVQTEATGGQLLVTVQGRAQVGYRGARIRKRIDDPGLFTGLTLLHVLRQRGIKIKSDRIKRGKVPEREKVLVTNYSEPLALSVREMNKRSSNFAAEQVLKVLGAEVVGAPGTWPSGLKAVAQYLSSIGIVPGTYKISNGSGLYEENRFTPLQLTLLLRAAYRDFRISADYLASLAVAGVDGTLAKRHHGKASQRYVRGKTGTLARVVSLSGYAGASSREGPLAFSYLVAEVPPGKIGAARRAADAVAEALVRYLEQLKGAPGADSLRK
jgi:D-alanyl-D-alanine carboxypeptidase/D-alanyl-D-alanine-endopeptidase (penicillin-binding protein 4)